MELRTLVFYPSGLRPLRAEHTTQYLNLPHILLLLPYVVEVGLLFPITRRYRPGLREKKKEKKKMVFLTKQKYLLKECKHWRLISRMAALLTIISFPPSLIRRLNYRLSFWVFSMSPSVSVQLIWKASSNPDRTFHISRATKRDDLRFWIAHKSGVFPTQKKCEIFGRASHCPLCTTFFFHPIFRFRFLACCKYCRVLFLCV